MSYSFKKITQKSYILTLNHDKKQHKSNYQCFIYFKILIIITKTNEIRDKRLNQTRENTSNQIILI